MIPLLVLLALAGLMHTTRGFSHEQAGGGAEMGFGYLLLSAFFAGNLCARARMPKLTGYILVGVAVGPSALALIDPATMGGLHMVGDVATALIALAGGAELELRVMRPLMRTILAMVGWAVLGTMAILTVTLLAIRPLVPFLDVLAFGDAVAVAAVLAVALAAQSPAVVMALIGETRAGGSVTRTVLAVVILADLVVVLAYGVLSSVATAVIGGHADVAAVAGDIGWEIVGSLAIGLVVGVVMARFLIHVSGGVGLFTIMVCLVVSQVAAAVHLDALVVMLSAGIYLQNRSRAPVHKLIESFEAASLPIYLVFFALAGAKVDLGLLASVAAPVGILVGARAIAFFVGARIAARRSDAPDAVRKHAWFGLLPQAGLALALAELLRKTFPTFGDQAFALVLGVVGANQIIGPVLLRVALVRSGEAGKAIPTLRKQTEMVDDPEPPVPRARRSRGSAWSFDAAAFVLRPMRTLLAAVVGDEPPLELQLVGRVVLEAILVGLTVGIVGCLFLVGLDEVERLVLDRAIAYPHLRAAGERGASVLDGSARLYLVLLVPAVGALFAGLVSRLAPEVRGGGGDAMINAFHHRGGAIRRRVILLKPLASIATLGFGGAGGREGPTMQLGGAIGTWIGGLLPSTERERRVLMIAGVAAGLYAVFRTPLGAALLAIEVLYRDDFESDALIPAVLASVVAYSLSATLISTEPVFGTLPRFPFRWEHLPFYAVTAVLVALAAFLFVRLLRGVEHLAERLPGPAWTRPAIGALALGVFAVAVLVIAPRAVGGPPSHFGVLGGGYGASQLAISGDAGLGLGTVAAFTLLLAAVLRAVATSLTIGSGGSAGDFAPSMAIGALVGGAIGHACAAWFDVGGLAPGAFALVGMATFYGGIAKVPLAATVMVCEMAGSYDLLVPLMLAQAIAFVALRRAPLYPSQFPSQRFSPAHAPAWARTEAVKVHAADLIAAGRTVVTLRPEDDADAVLRAMADAPGQSVFPVLDERGALRGLVTGAGTREIAASEDASWAIAADLMISPVSVLASVSLGDVARVLLDHDLRGVPVLDPDGAILGIVDEHDVSRAYMAAAEAASRMSRQIRAVELP